MKTEFRRMGAGKVLREKTQRKNLPHENAERDDGASGARGGSNPEQLASNCKNPAPLYSTFRFAEHCHICFPRTLLNCQVQWA